MSRVAEIKSRYPVKINMEQEMRVTVCHLIPRFERYTHPRCTHLIAYLTIK